jgi:hypothetical protein
VLAGGAQGFRVRITLRNYLLVYDEIYASQARADEALADERMAYEAQGWLAR